MRHEDIPPVPFTAWIREFNGEEVKEVYVTEYGRVTGATVGTVLIEGDGRPFRASVNFIYASADDVKAEIGAGMRETVKNYRQTIAELERNIAKYLAHPYFHCT